MIGKVLIILGGNSTLIDKFLQTKIEKKYQKIIIISHREYKGFSKHKIIDFLDPALLENTLKNILSDNSFEYDLIISNTPPQNANFNIKKTLDWGMSSIKVMKMQSINDKFKKIIFTGSCLPLLPIYHKSFYKELKYSEINTYIKLDNKYYQNFTYIILPPLKLSNHKFSFIYDTYENWAYILKKELGLNNRIVYPKGIVGFVTKILFFIRFRQL
jgi:hypothetical protein